MLADISHEQHGAILGEERRVADIGCWDRELKIAFGGIPEIPVQVLHEANFLVTRNHAFDIHCVSPKLVASPALASGSRGYESLTLLYELTSGWRPRLARLETLAASSMETWSRGTGVNGHLLLTQGSTLSYPRMKIWMRVLRMP